MNAKVLLLTGVFFFCFSLMAQKTKVFTLNVFFETDKAILSDKEKGKIETLMDTLDFDRIKLINLKGHTDSRADSLYNVKLSERRTSAVADFMKTLDVPMAKVSQGAFGENLPATENETDLGKQKNRRVEIRLVYLFPVPNTIIKKDTILEKVFDPCEGDTILKYSTGILLMVDKCNYKILSRCVRVRTVTNTSQIRQENLRMQDNRGNDLISDGMFKFEWDSTCGGCRFVTKWLMTEADYKQSGYNFYSYDERGRAWNVLRKRRIKRVKIEGKIYYEVEMNCDDFGVWCNKDKRRFRPAHSKIKVAGRWQIVGVESESRNNGFYIKPYHKTETFDSKKKWKMLPMASDVFIIRKKGSKDTLHIPFMALSPRKVKLFRYRLTNSYGFLEEGWPHVKTKRLEYNKTIIKSTHLYYRKYKIKAKTIRRLMKIKQHDRILR